MEEIPSHNPPAPGRARLHIRVGWWLLLLFLSLGIVLEGLHGFKSDWYLNLDHATRRTLWRLAHAHGTLLALVHLAYGFCSHYCFRHSRDLLWHLASPFLTTASLLLPAGFLLGGAVLYDESPGPGIVLVPVGAVLLSAAVLFAALAATRSKTAPSWGRDCSSPGR